MAVGIQAICYTPPQKTGGLTYIGIGPTGSEACQGAFNGLMAEVIAGARPIPCRRSGSATYYQASHHRTKVSRCG